MRNQKAGGAILAYFNILLSMLSNILLVPIMIGFLSDADYSIYKVMQSFAGPLVMFNLGISTIASRCVAKYRASDRTDPTEKENTLALSMIVGVAMALLILVLGFVMRQAIPGVFGSNYSISQIQTAQKVFLVLVANTAIHVLSRRHQAVFYSIRCLSFLLRYTGNSEKTGAESVCGMCWNFTR